MARLNVYIPDELAERARAAGLNVSGISQEAISGVLAGRDTDAWLDSLDRLPECEIAHDRILAALDEARAEFGG